MNYKTIIISDVHLGNPYSNWKKLESFLKENTSEFLFLNGDIIDERYLVNNNKELSNEELNFLLELINNNNTIYIIGNHEDFNRSIGEIGEIWEKYNIRVWDKCLYENFFISHGHNTIFQNPITENKLLLRFIDASIRWLAKFQKFHKGIIFEKGKFEIKKGTEFAILSQDSRKFFKTALKIVSRYKRKIKKFKNYYKTDSVICGHIHHPEIKKSYMNSGDWLENNSVLVQKLDGNWEILKWKK